MPPQHTLLDGQHTLPQHALPDGQHLPLQHTLHGLSQLPQWVLSVRVSTHVPRQLVRPTGHCVQAPGDTVQFRPGWSVRYCTHATRSLWDSDGAQVSAHWAPRHHVWTAYPVPGGTTPTL